MNTFNEITFKNRLSSSFSYSLENGMATMNLTNLLNDFGQTSADFDADDNV